MIQAQKSIRPIHPNSIIETKVKNLHQERFAIVYIRQSSMSQVHQNQESTQIQYGLVNHAESLGWPLERVLVIDDDLGLSGASTEGRLGFQRLLSEIALNHVGIVLGVEMSRLARSCKDWYQLLELCAIFNTLICDLDGIYDPSCYNDRLLLGLKGTMSEAELHIIRQRMWQGALQKAKRGELVSKGPMGYICENETLILDPDEQVQSVIRLVFDLFNRVGSMHAVLRHLVANGIQLPVRLSLRTNGRALEWRRPNQTAIKNILTHPTYAGAYVFGRSTKSKKSKQQKLPSRIPRDQWLVLLRDHFPAYISWEQYEENQLRLEQNRSRCDTRGSIRQGAALLAGLVVCGRCGYGLRTRYGGYNSKPSYRCSARTSLYADPDCQSIKAKTLDDEVARLAMLALQPAAIEVSLQVTQDLQQQRQKAEDLWSKRLERAAYEVDRTSRQYHAVEPENRLVARNLELAWEEKLRAHRGLIEQHERFQREQPRVLSAEEIEHIHRLSIDIPTIWSAPATTDADRKAIIREIVDRVEVNVEGKSDWVEAWVHWAGGSKTYTRFQRPVASLAQLSNGKQIVIRISELLESLVSIPKIAEQLNSEGFKTPRGKRFDTSRVTKIMRCNGLHSKRQVKKPTTELGKDEWFIVDLMKETNLSYGKIYRLIMASRLTSRKDKLGRWIVKVDKQTLKAIATNELARVRTT
jgi:DNA invertase Pin-like site-specific DNA recombinase